MDLFVVFLLVINAALVLAIILVLLSLGKQTQRVTRIAREAHDLAERAERDVREAMAPGVRREKPAGEDAPPQTSDDPEAPDRET